MHCTLLHVVIQLLAQCSLFKSINAGCGSVMYTYTTMSLLIEAATVVLFIRYDYCTIRSSQHIPYSIVTFNCLGKTEKPYSGHANTVQYSPLCTDNKVTQWHDHIYSHGDGIRNLILHSAARKRKALKSRREMLLLAKVNLRRVRKLATECHGFEFNIYDNNLILLRLYTRSIQRFDLRGSASQVRPGPKSGVPPKVPQISPM